MKGWRQMSKKLRDEVEVARRDEWVAGRQVDLSKDSVCAPTYCRVTGSISAYQTTSGKRYRAMFRTPDHAQTQKRGFKTKREAALFLASVEIDKSRGGAYIDPSQSRVLVEEWLVTLSHQAVSPQGWYARQTVSDPR